MYRNNKVTIYIPCRNESNNLETIKSSIPSFVDEIIVVSNRSTDDTYEKALSLGFKAFKDDRELNGIGYGFAHMTGIEKATGDIILSIDGDAEHPLDNLTVMLDKFIDSKYDFMYCHRLPPAKGSKISAIQKLGVYVLNITAFILYGKYFNDILSGMWFIRKEVKSQLNLTQGDWNLSPQIKINVAKNKDLKMGEYSIRQNRRSKGNSKQQYLKTGLSHLGWLISNRFASLKA
ncbi:MAG: glycosyltransferase family 2 protein [Candidatus Dojkabacteria bacterium]